jgi:hypothetical protein
VTTDEEVAAFRDFYKSRFGFVLPELDFWVEHRPDVLKRFRLHVLVTGTDVCSTLAMLHSYTLVRSARGVASMIRWARLHDVSKTQILETLAVAFLDAAPDEMSATADAAQALLSGFDDTPKSAAAFPDGWAPDAQAFRSGIDFSTPVLTAEDIELLEAWYDRVCGETPQHVRFLARHRPSLLKTYRGRFEFAIRDALPKQMMPYLQLHWNTVRGFAPGIREAALIGRGFGMRQEEILHAVGRASNIGGGAAAVSLAAAELEPLLSDGWN